MTDIIKTEPSPSLDDRKLGQQFGVFDRKRYNRNKQRSDTENYLAAILRDLENINTERVNFTGLEKRKSNHKSWFGFWHQSEDDAFRKNSASGRSGKNKHSKGKNYAVASVSALGLESLGIASLFSNIHGGTLFGIFQSADAIIRVTTVALAIGCTSLPFVVYHMQNYGGGGSLEQMQESAHNTEFKPHPAWYKRARFEPIDKVDPYARPDYDSTVPVMSNGKGLPKVEIAEQNGTVIVPTSRTPKPFIVKKVVNGMAMIEYDQGYWFAAPGSTLPDGSRYIYPRKDTWSGKMELKTSHGSVPVTG